MPRPGRSKARCLTRDEERVTETIHSLLDDCLNGTTLDLQYFGEAGLPGEYPAPGDVPGLHPDAWAQLDGYVRGRQGQGIVGVLTSLSLRTWTP